MQSTPGKTVLCLAQQFYITETGAAVLYCDDALFSGPCGPAHLFVTCGTSKAGWGPESKDIVIFFKLIVVFSSVQCDVGG